MSFRVIDGGAGTDDDDAFADRDEDPREAIGYATPSRPDPEPHPTLEPRHVRPPAGVGHFAIAWVPGEAATAEGRGGPVGGEKVCRECREPAPVLHADPRSTHPQRVICGGCAGRFNRDRMDGGRR